MPRHSLLLALVLWSLAACKEAPAVDDGSVKGGPGEVTKPPTKSVPPAPTGTASALAVRLADYKTKEHGPTAAAIPAKQPLRIYDFDIELEQPILADPETRLPWIANIDERSKFRGKKALILPLKSRNDAPVARELLLGFILHTRDGKTHSGGVYNERLAAKQLGRIAWFDLRKQAPDTWVETVLVFDVDPAQLEGAVVYVARWITVRDRFGRQRSVVEQHLVADLAAAKDGPPIAAAR